MIKSKDNYPKAIAVYEAVLQLIHEERDLQSVTVSEIAKKAGIGKGTTYDYFESKEEIIAKALIYGYKKMIAYLMQKTKKCDSLKEKIICMYDVVEEVGCVNMVVESAMKMVRKPEQMKAHINEAFSKDKIHVEYYNQLIEELTVSARDEELVSNAISNDYIMCVFYTLIQTIVNRNGVFFINNKMFDKEQYLDYIYQMTISALAAGK